MSNTRRLLFQIPRAQYGAVCMGLAVGGGTLLVGSGKGMVQLSELSLQFQPAGSPVTLGTTVGLKGKDSQFQPVDDDPITFVMIGMTGHGKSASGNTLVGMTKFGVSNSSRSVTEEVASQRFEFGGVEYLAIDLPGFEDTNHSLDDIQRQLALVAHHAKGHVHALVIVHRRGRATKEVQKVIDYVVQQFGQEALVKYGIIVLTDTTESGNDIRLDVRDLPEENSYRKLVLSLPSQRVMSLQNAYVSETFQRWRQRRMILQQIRSLYEDNESSTQGRPSPHLDCEAFRKKRLEDEESRLKEEKLRLTQENEQLQNQIRELNIKHQNIIERAIERVVAAPIRSNQGSGCTIS